MEITKNCTAFELDLVKLPAMNLTEEVVYVIISMHHLLARSQGTELTSPRNKHQYSIVVMEAERR